MSDSARTFSKNNDGKIFIKKAANLQRHNSRSNQQEIDRRRTNSEEALEELVQCGICLERFNHPKMLPCQHTFCLACLQAHLVSKRLALETRAPGLSQMRNALSNLDKFLVCPMCMQKHQLEKDLDSLESLPTNLYIDSLLKLLENNSSKIGIIKENFETKCVKCQIVCEIQNRNCQHCLQIFCNLCWNEHMKELEEKLTTLSKQLEESEIRLSHKLDNFENRCEQLNETIKSTSETKIALIKSLEKSALEDVKKLKRDGELSSKEVKDRIENMKKEITVENLRKVVDSQKVSIYMQLHKDTSELVDAVFHWGETRIIFDPDLFRLEQDNQNVYADVEEDFWSSTGMVHNPLENPESMLSYYTSKRFVAKLVWTKCPRPAGLGIPPWEPNHLYIAATDSHNVLILDRQRVKLIGRLTSSEMLCPQNLAFSSKREEIFVTDKWKHCIHVFSKAGDYLRVLCSKGSGEGKVRSPDGIATGPNDELVVCDTGNDRILILDSEFGTQIRSIGIIGRKTEMNVPTGVAIHKDKIIVADSGNHRIKLYNFEGEKLSEFGSLGRRRGQFRSAEVVAVDPMGFILVGDAGNGRIQIFKMDGTFVRAFGQGDSSGWISGLLFTPDLEIIVTDIKNRKLQIF